jgi:glucokinase
MNSVCLDSEPALMTSRNDGPLALGIDLGGTKILVGVVNGNHKILGRAKRATPAKEGGPAIVQAMLACVDDALDAAGLTRSQIAGAGVGSPGPLDVKTGTILFSANMNVRNFPLGQELSVALGRPVVVRNDVRVAGTAEFRLGVGRGYRDVIAAFVGTGIGGCVIRGGEIVAGSTGNAGEIGHMIVKAGGPRCGCGARGCMEALASKTAIARRVDKAIRKGLPTMLADKMARKGGRLKSGDLSDAVAARDIVALKEVQRAAHFLGIGLGSLINAFGPEIVIIGGGVAEALGDPYLELVRSAARSQAFTDPDGKIRIERAALGDDAGILGAALLAREQFVKR